MYIIFALARYFPFWGLVVALIFWELGRYFRRYGLGLQYSCFFMALVFLGAVGAWIYFRGDIHSDQWVRDFLFLK